LLYGRFDGIDDRAGALAGRFVSQVHDRFFAPAQDDRYLNRALITVSQLHRSESASLLIWLGDVPGRSDYAQGMDFR